MTSTEVATVVGAVGLAVGGLITPIIAFGVLVLAMIERNRAADRAAKVEEVKVATIREARRLRKALVSRSEHQDRQSAKQEEKIDHVIKLTNSMKDELVAEVKKASFAEGQKAESDREKSASGIQHPITPPNPPNGGITC